MEYMTYRHLADHAYDQDCGIARWERWIGMFCGFERARSKLYGGQIFISRISVKVQEEYII
jgi:hypothetical protein